MPFKDYVYKRPDVKALMPQFEAILTALDSAKDVSKITEVIDQFYALQDTLDTQSTLASIRHSIDTSDAFYDAEQAFFDATLPGLQAYNKRLADALLNSPFKAALKAHYGSLFFDKLSLDARTFDPVIVEDLQTENRLITAYGKLTASAEIAFDGKTLNLSQMAPYMQSKDRAERLAAQNAVSAFFEANESRFDELYDDLVKVRVKMANALGFESFTEMAYARLGRTDYNSADVARYRDQIYEEVTPLVAKLMEKKAVRLGIDDLKYYDLALNFLSGNPTPKGDRAWQVDKARAMYKDMHEETHAFFEMMLDEGLMDLDSQPKKEGGGYCTFLADQKKPFIFANFNGTSHDVDVLTHEAGHAFQMHMSRDLFAPTRFPTLESAEIHSMSMEFLAWPYMESFFKEDTAKYTYTHLAGALSFLPYGVAVDEFQHGIYENPALTPTERKALWRTIEKKYLPYKEYAGNDFYERGGFWFRQGHIFSVPFYYIDYTLAQVVAFQYWHKSQDDYQAALESYVTLCGLGGSESFTSLLKSAGLDNPFETGTVKKIAGPIQAFIDSVDDRSL